MNMFFGGNESGEISRQAEAEEAFLKEYNDLQPVRFRRKVTLDALRTRLNEIEFVLRKEKEINRINRLNEIRANLMFTLSQNKR